MYQTYPKKHKVWIIRDEQKVPNSCGTEQYIFFFNILFLSLYTQEVEILLASNSGLPKERVSSHEAIQR